MAERDPFPMKSEQAAKLAASVNNAEGGEGDGTSWVEMSVNANKTSNAKPPAGASSGGAQKMSLTGSKKRSKKKFGDEYDDESDEDDEADDDFLNRPLGSRPTGPLGYMHTLLTKLSHRLYGENIPLSEVIRVFVLGLTLFFMIGGYWLMRSLKDPVLTALCGVEAIPKAKMLSVFVVLGVVSVYNKMLDSSLPRHQLFFIFGMFYFGFFAIIAKGLTHEVYGLPNEQPDPGRLLGWISYCGIESFGSVMVSLFWSFANSNVGLETAKSCYGLLVATAQVGSILGPMMVKSKAETWGVPTLYFMGAMAMLCLQGTMFLYIWLYGAEVVVKKKESAPGKPKPGVLEGLYLFWEHNYIKGIFAISCLFMVEVTIVDFTMKILAKEHFSELHPCVPNQSCWNHFTNQPTGLSAEATASFTTFMGLFGQATNTLSFVMSLFGTSAVIRTLGLRLTLLLFPTICLISIIFVRFSPTLYSVFAVMIILKASSYALNNPTKEILYQPTSSAVKYKAKSWIDIFGARGSKAMGSVVTNAFSDSASNLVANGSLVGMAVASFLIWNARFMGNKFDEYTESGHVVGSEEEDENTHMALKQNEDIDTSCALDDDAEDESSEEDDDDDKVSEEELEAKNGDVEEGGAKVEMV